MATAATVTTYGNVTIDALLAEYRARNQRSYEIFQRSQTVLPGGNTRTGVFVDPFPFYIDHAAEAGERAKFI